MVTRTLARLPEPRAVTISSGTSIPVAVLSPCRIVVRNRILPSFVAGSALVLEDRHDVAGRVLEPGDRRSPRVADDALVVLLEVGIPLHPDAGRDQGIDSGIDVPHLEVENGE